MSLGGSGSEGTCTNNALHMAICNSVAAGVTYVVAAGNSGADFAGFVPAAFNEVLTVTAAADFNGQPGGGAAATCRSDVDDTAADFSNFTTTTAADAGHTIAGPRRLHPVDMEAGRLQHHLGDEHGGPACRRDSRTLHRRRAVRRQFTGAGHESASKRRRSTSRGVRLRR